MQAVPVYEPQPMVIPVAVPVEPIGRLVTRREVIASLLSLAFHQAVIIALGLLVLPEVVGRPRFVLSSSVEAPRIVTPPEIEPLMQQLTPRIVGPQGGQAAENVQAVRASVPEPRRKPALDSPSLESASAVLARVDAPQYKSRSELMQEAGTAGSAAPKTAKPQRKRTDPAAGGIVAAAGPGDAVEGVLAGIRNEWAGGDLLVVWLLDASLSLVDDRQIIAERLDPFYREIAPQQGEPHVLMSAAVAYGQGTVELQDITRYGVRLAKAAAQEVVIDPTGLENVMKAVRECVAKYRRTWKNNMLIVVWTDESGDDILQLEDTIAYCRAQNVGVSVVGPTAVFGSERGFHPYTDLPTGYRFLLPVKRGPDTSLPERMPLPFWHETPLAPWSQQGAQIDTGGPWFGGAYREGLLSGVGPYALTRLAMETGGTFTLLDPEGDARPFNFEKQRAYLPDYVSAAEYLRQVQYSPLRRAIFEAVQLGFREHERLVVPKLSFISARGEFYPFDAFDLYVNPTAFRVDLKDEFADETSRVAAALALIEQAIARFGVEGMETEYEREKSLRWKAWYDLTLGRLLATSVRQIEYLQTCKLVFDNAAFLNPETNHIKFVASSSLISTDQRVHQRAAEAERLLRRCVEQHAGTPFALLAQWELDRPLGLTVRQIVIPPPPPPMPVIGGPIVPRAPVPPLPRF